MFLSCGKAPHYECLTQDNHPRLFLNDSEFAEFRKDVNDGSNKTLRKAHTDAMKLATDHGLCPDPIIYQKDASGKRLLSVSRESITRILSAAYAFRFTGEEIYLKHAEQDLNTICDFPDWNHTHYLDCAEMATAAAIGYDWLYKHLQDSTKAKIVSALKEKAFRPSDFEESFTYCKWKETASNWNQVCNGGLIIAALATFEDNPDWSRQFIEAKVESNREAMEGIYPPQGAYPEGPVYWVYGNMYQVLLLGSLESALGTDFQLSQVEGFARTGLFEAFMDGNTDQLFNYGDNLAARIPMYPLWYLAWKFDSPEILYRENATVFLRPYVHIECERFLPIYLKYIWKIKPESIREPELKVLFSQGSTPSAVVRTGWKDCDSYLGIKGGSPGSSHSHMDAGEFVYERDGVRWAADLSRQEYAQLENPCKALGGDLWDFSQNSVRWRLFRYTTAQHNVLMVNGHMQKVDGNARMTATFDTPEYRGAEFDLSEIYAPDLKYAIRRAGIVVGGNLEVRDSVCAPSSVSAHIRWTLVSQSEPEITPDGIVLRSNGLESLLQVKGAEVTFHIYPSGIYSSDPELAGFDLPVRECICGYEYDLPAGCAAQVTTVLSRIN